LGRLSLVISVGHSLKERSAWGFSRQPPTPRSSPTRRTRPSAPNACARLASRSRRGSPACSSACPRSRSGSHSQRLSRPRHRRLRRFAPRPLTNALPFAAAIALTRGFQGVGDRSSELLPLSQAHKLAFVNGKAEKETVNPHALTIQPSPYTLLAGSVISASLITGVNSDLPGQVIAQVTEQAYDTVSGAHLLIPQGTRLIGKYDSVVAFGQKRALLVWTRLILPNGTSIVIDNLPAADANGYAGLEDEVDFHTWQLIKGIGLTTLLGVGTQITLGNDEGDLIKALRESIQQTTNRAGQRLVERQLDVQPTITVRPGWPVRVIVAKDLVLKPYVDAHVRSPK
jgi:type IV secretion system protein TrbI